MPASSQPSSPPFRPAVPPAPDAGRWAAEPRDETSRAPPHCSSLRCAPLDLNAWMDRAGRRVHRPRPPDHAVSGRRQPTVRRRRPEQGVENVVVEMVIRRRLSRSSCTSFYRGRERKTRQQKACCTAGWTWWVAPCSSATRAAPRSTRSWQQRARRAAHRVEGGRGAQVA